MLGVGLPALISTLPTDALLVATAAAAEGPETDHTDKRRLLESKLALLARLVYRTPSVKRIEDSDDSEAKTLLDAARASLDKAKATLALGDLQVAESHLDQGLRRISAAARRSVQTLRDEDSAEKRYRQLKERVSSFRQAFEAVAPDRQAEAASLMDEAHLQELVSQAESLAADHRYSQAVTRLTEAAGIVEAALAKARDKETLIYTLEFESPEEEYAYEVERNRSHMMLVELLLAKRSITKPARGYILSMVEENEKLRVEAESLAENGETEKAIAKLEDATKGLVQALRIGGMAIP
jgi:hypothetical protein